MQRLECVCVLFDTPARAASIKKCTLESQVSRKHIWIFAHRRGHHSRRARQHFWHDGFLLFNSVCIAFSNSRVCVYPCHAIKLPGFDLLPFRVREIWLIFRRFRPSRVRVASYSICDSVVLHNVYTMNGKAFAEVLRFHGHRS